MLTMITAVALVATLKLCAGDAPAANPFFGTLSTVSPAELPAKAAELVSQADAKNRVETTINVVKAAVGLNPAAAAAIVGTIALSTPEMASVAAATAVKLVPNQAIAIARAAAAAAPSQAGKIVEAVCRVVPSAYQEVANAVAGVAPGEGKAILAGVSAAIPVLQDPINKVLISNNGGNPSVSDVLGQVSTTTTMPTASLISPTTVTPLVSVAQPLVTFKPVKPPVSPVNYSSGSGGQVPTGGRDIPAP
jgi:hypothetical protein